MQGLEIESDRLSKILSKKEKRKEKTLEKGMNKDNNQEQNRSNTYEQEGKDYLSDSISVEKAMKKMKKSLDNLPKSKRKNNGSISQLSLPHYYTSDKINSKTKQKKSSKFKKNENLRR